MELLDQLEEKVAELTVRLAEQERKNEVLTAQNDNLKALLSQQNEQEPA